MYLNDHRKNEVVTLLLKGIILHCQNEIKRERTINSVFHLLTGKQSIQTIQDANLYQLENYYALYKPLNKKVFDQQIKELVERNYLSPQGELSYDITPEGLHFLESVKLNKYYWNGLTFREIDRLFFQRLLLFIQVWTNSRNNKQHYIPIVEHPETLLWIKQFYRTDQTDRLTRLKQLYSELVDLFSQLSSFFPQLFIEQITTTNSIGLTYEQLAARFDKSVTDIYLLHINYVHFILEKVINHNSIYPLLHLFVKDLKDNKQEKTITQSAKITNLYIEQGLTPEEIAVKRNLKINTIFDHIVEIALHDEHFPLHKFVPIDKQEEIYRAVRQLQSLKLKEIKQVVDEDISYFQIRLALTKLNRVMGE